MNAAIAFAAAHYGPRAGAYVDSAVHKGGPDLDQIEQLVREGAPSRVLDLGCGGGHVSCRAAPHAGLVVACDITPQMLAAVSAMAADHRLANIRTVCAPAERLPLADASFDAVLCRFTTHHWDDMEAGLLSARRVLAPGGLAVFVDSVAPPDPAADTHLQAVELLRDASHVRNYGTPEWEAALSRAGFMLDGVTVRRIRMEYASWIARTAAPQLRADAIRSLQDSAPPHVRAHFAIGNDGSFDLEVGTFVARGGSL